MDLGEVLTSVQAVATIVATIAVPIILAILGNRLTDNMKARDAKLRTTELAIAILRDDPKSSPETPSLRQWAVNVIDDLSGVPFPEGAKKELQQNRLLAPEDRMRLREYAIKAGLIDDFGLFSNRSVTLSDDEFHKLEAAIQALREIRAVKREDDSNTDEDVEDT